MSVMRKSLSPKLAALAFVVCAVAMVAAGLIRSLRGGQLWAIEAALMIAMVAIVGLGVTGTPAGVLVNAQKVMSLSRFQTVLWTILLLSAYVTIVLRRMGQPDPLAVAIDWELWALMGISTTSLVGTPLLKMSKITKELASGAAADAAAAFGQTPSEVERDAAGILYVNPSIEDARFTDIFGGDEVGDTHFVDVGKVQMFVFTIVAAVSYGVALYRLVDRADPATITEFPALGSGLVAILAISHTGYLGGKATRQTPVADEAKGTAASRA